MYKRVEVCTSDTMLGFSPVTTLYERYMGFSPYKVDPKYRISIPTSWRPEAGEALYLMFSRVHELPVLKVLSKAAYDEKVELLRNSDKSPKEKASKLGKLALRCHKASLNDQNKLLVGKDLAEMAGIAPESSVVLAGRGIFFEIWSEANFNTMLNIETSEEEDDDDLGIF